MRFLLLIPVCVLILANVPLIQEMPMESMMAMVEKQEKKDCSKNATQEEQKSCHSKPDPQPAPMACHSGTMPVDGACQPSGANCVCICVFQFAAPANDLKLFQFLPVNI